MRFFEGCVRKPAGVGKAMGCLFACGRVSLPGEVQILAEVGMVIVLDNVPQRLNREVDMYAV